MNAGNRKGAPGSIQPATPSLPETNPSSSLKGLDMKSLPNTPDTYENNNSRAVLVFPLDPKTDPFPADIRHFADTHASWCSFADMGPEVSEHGPMCESRMKDAHATLANGDLVTVITALAQPYRYGDYPAARTSTHRDDYVLLYLANGSKDLAEVLLPIRQARRIATQLQTMANIADGIQGPENGGRS